MDTSNNFEQVLERFGQLLSIDPGEISPPSIVDVILGAPNVSTAEALALSTYAAARRQPKKVDFVFGKVMSVLRDERVEALNLVDGDGVSSEFRPIFDRQFDEIITDNIYLHEGSSDDELKSVGEDSTALQAVLIQCFALRMELVDSAHHILVARQGLGLDECLDGREVMEKAVLLVFLSIGGWTAIKGIARLGTPPDAVRASLRKLEDSDTFKDATTKMVLEQVLGTLDRDYITSAEEVWDTMFLSAVL